MASTSHRLAGYSSTNSRPASDGEMMKVAAVAVAQRSQATQDLRGPAESSVFTLPFGGPKPGAGPGMQSLVITPLNFLDPFLLLMTSHSCVATLSLDSIVLHLEPCKS